MMANFVTEKHPCEGLWGGILQIILTDDREGTGPTYGAGPLSKVPSIKWYKNKLVPETQPQPHASNISLY